MSQMNFLNTQEGGMLSVGELTRRIRARLEEDPELQNIWVTGEVSNVSQPRSGHLYFTLKDARSSLKCVMWKQQVMRLRFLPRDGDNVEVFGSIGVYETGGQYQLYAVNIQPAGQGQLYQEYLRLKAALEAEGLFDLERKRQLPAWPGRIGIVTSQTGAALQDMLNTIERRFPIADVLLSPTAVQGIEAPTGIVQSIELLNERSLADVILVARGGGSMEDLWAFNDERVVRAIAASQIPVVCGVGHETDFTLSDFAADVRAPTPTAAAEIATPDQAELFQGLQESTRLLDQLLQGTLDAARWRLSDLHSQLMRQSPTIYVRNNFQKLDDRNRQLARAITRSLQTRTLQLETMMAKLEGVNPLAILQRGYSVVTDQAGRIVRSVAQVSPGETLHVRASDGEYQVEVRSRKAQTDKPRS